MKKFLLSLMALFAGTCAFAAGESEVLNDVQIEDDTAKIMSLKDVIEQQQSLQSKSNYESHIQKVWKYSKYFNISYNTTDFKFSTPMPKCDSEVSPGMEVEGYKFKQKFGVSIISGKNYRLHKKPIAKMVGINLDYTPLDLSVNYFEAEGNGKYDSRHTYTYMDDKSSEEAHYRAWNLEKLEVSYGMSLGPSITVAPFVPLHKSGLDFIKLNFFFHVGYCASLLYILNDKDADINQSDVTGYSSVDYDEMKSDFKADFGHGLFTSFGLDLSWRWIGVGYERRQGKLEYFSLNKTVYGSDKFKMQNVMNRVYVNFRF